MRWEGPERSGGGFRRNTLTGLYNRHDFLFIESVLGFLSTKVEFQEDVDHFAIVSPPLINSLQQMQRIHRLDQRSVRKDELELVGLEVTDEVPFDVGGHLGHFGSQFLRTVLAEDTLARIVGLHQPFDRVEFGNCHQFDT